MNKNSGWQKYLELIPILIIAFMLFKIVDSSVLLGEGLGFFISMFNYFISAFAVAYFLNPLMKIIDKRTNHHRWLTLIILYAIVIGGIVLAFRIITPRLIQNISDLIEDIPEYYTIAEDWLSKTIAEFKVNDTFGIIPYLENAVGGLTERITITLTQLLNGILSGLMRGTNFVASFIIALIISVYMLKDKEIIIRGFKRFVTALINNKTKSAAVFRFAEDVDDIFSRYIIGKVIDSTIIGLLCYIGLVIMNIPYAVVLGFIVGLTNMIPYFGPFIGMIPAFGITIFSGFWPAVATLTFVFILQQFDGWYLGPRILGGSVGLGPLWIIMAITVGGRLYGLPGMFLGVPVMAVLKKLLDEFIIRRNNPVEW